MNPLSDRAMARLREAADFPDLQNPRYRIVRRLARGGMGTVFLAEDSLLDRSVAVKVSNFADLSAETLARMRKEATVIARLEHPGIVPIHDLGQTSDGRVYYVMRLVQGRRLDEYVRQTESPAERLRTFQKICETVAFAHSTGVLHRDLKPENIMVGPFGEVMVMDWGVAKVLAEAGTTKIAESRTKPPDDDAQGSPTDTARGTVMGTPAYMAPEQIAGNTDRIDARTDVYLLGAVLYFLLTERAPFGSGREDRSAPAPPRKFNSKTARAVEAICLKAMSFDPLERYTDVPEMNADITRFLDGLSVSAHPESVVERAGRFVRRNQFLLLLIAAYLVMRIFVLFAFQR